MHFSSPLSGVDVMVEFGVNIAESIVGELPTEMDTNFRQILKDFITEKVPFETSCVLVTELLGSSDPIIRINDIINLPDEPLRYVETEEELSTSIRKRTRTWSIAEDQRLLAGVFHFGTENWQAVAHFLGSGRNRAQCSQRWTRCLNPTISKKSWTAEEDQQLESLIKTHGEKCWTKISAIMGNRSDVQCRYRYKQLQSVNNANRKHNDLPNLPLAKSNYLTKSSESLPVKKPPMVASLRLPPQPPKEIQEARLNLRMARPLTGSMPVFNLGYQKPFSEQQILGILPPPPPNPCIQRISYAPQPIGISMGPMVPKRVPDIPKIPQRNVPSFPFLQRQQIDSEDQSTSLDKFLSHFQ